MYNIYGKKIELYEWQQQINIEKDTIIIAPTGAGKSVAAYLWADIENTSYKRIIFTSPIKALSNERYLELRKMYGKENVGIFTGDVKINEDAKILCMTQEIYTNSYAKRARQKVIIDEVHYMFQDLERARAYVDGLIKTHFTSKLLLLSATINEKSINYFEKLTNRTLEKIIVKERPVQIEYIGKQTYDSIIKEYHPALIFAFSPKDILKIANKLYDKREEYRDIKDYAEKFHINNEKLIELSRKGIGLYYGYMKLKEKLFVEYLVRKGIIDIVVGTDALALGVNLPVKCVFFTQLIKNGENISKREFLQMSGRAGRPNLHEIGYLGFIETDQCNKERFEMLLSAPLEEERLLIPIDYRKLLNNISWETIKNFVKYDLISRTLALIIEEEADYISQYSLTGKQPETIFKKTVGLIKHFLTEVYRLLKPYKEKEKLYQLLQSVYYHEIPLDVLVDCAAYIYKHKKLDAVEFYKTHDRIDNQRNLLQYLRFYHHIRFDIKIDKLEKFKDIIRKQDEFVIEPWKIEEIEDEVVNQPTLDKFNTS
ncbi:MAG TPA: DEAD/DEAH box helicase, partial [Hydrogenobaculum sp.]|nr:DEAD/DEAH box helicase [Hydrogenobaculum sp.]